MYCLFKKFKYVIFVYYYEWSKLLINLLITIATEQNPLVFKLYEYVTILLHEFFNKEMFR